MTGPARLAIVVNSSCDGVLAPRAKTFASRLGSDFVTEVLWRESIRPLAFLSFLARLRRFRPDVVYLVDLGYPAVLASLLYVGMTSSALVIETGDPLAELFWSTGRVGRIGRLALRQYERSVLLRADRVVVRGSGLQQYLATLGVTRIDVVPDGVDTTQFHPMQVDDLRRELDLEGLVSVGVMGTLNWSTRLQWGYGGELIEALARLKHLPVCGLVVGDGPGRRILAEKCAELNVSGRVRFVGRISQEALPRYINAMDICLSTQTNDWVGRSRTTAKLPLFLACGRFVLASRVGEAARVLPEEMLVDYSEGFDASYPARLAERIQRLVSEPMVLGLRGQARRIAISEFDYEMLVLRVAKVLREVLERRAMITSA